MAAQFPFVEIKPAPETVSVAKLAPNSVLALAPNRRLWQAQDTQPGGACRVLAEYHLDGAFSWAVPAGTLDPDSVAELYPDHETWRTVAVSDAKLTSGCMLEGRVLYCPSGLTIEDTGDAYQSRGAWAELRIRVTWSRKDGFTSAAHDFEVLLEGSTSGTWGGRENNTAAADWRDIKEKVVERIAPNNFFSSPAIAAIYSEATSVRIEMQVRGGERIVHAIVYEVPTLQVQSHSDDAMSLHCAPVGALATPRRPQTDAVDGTTYENNRWGTTRTLQANELQGERFGPRILNFSTNIHNTLAWSGGATDQEPIVVGAGKSGALYLYDSDSTYSENLAGWIVAGSMAQIHRLNGPVMLRERAAVIPVRVTVDAQWEGAGSDGGTLRLQSGPFEWVDVNFDVDETRQERTAFGHLESQVYGDQFSGILVPLYILPDGDFAIYNISVDFGHW